jgi:large subunit ribosomal protein L24
MANLKDASIKVKHLKKGDTVVALSGNAKGKSGKVLEVKRSRALIRVEGIGTVKRHTKPSQSVPKGGIIEKLRWFPASKFQVASDSGKPKGRVGFKIVGDKKERVFASKAKGSK